MAKILSIAPFGQVWPLGRVPEAKSQVKHPERTAMKSKGWDYIFVVYPSREAMAKAIRKEEGIPVGRHSRIGTVSEELADVLMYVCTIASYYGVDLEAAFRAKDKVHSRRVWR